MYLSIDPKESAYYLATSYLTPSFSKSTLLPTTTITMYVKDSTDILRGVVLDLINPLLHLLKSLWRGNIVHNNSSLAVLVVYPCYGPVSLLTSRIPKLKFYLIPLHQHRLLHINCTQSRVQTLVELVLDIPNRQTAFTHPHCSNNHHLEL